MARQGFRRPVDTDAGQAPEVVELPATPAPATEAEAQVKFTVKLAESTAGRFSEMAHTLGRELGRHRSGPARGRPVSQADVLRAFLDAAEQDPAVKEAVSRAVAELLR